MRNVVTYDEASSLDRFDLPRVWLMRAGCIFTAAFSVFTLLGWLAGSDLLVRIAPGYVAMVPSTAFCLALLAGALLSGRAPLMLVAAAVATLIGVVEALYNFAGFEVGLDAALLPGLSPGDKMAFGTTVGLVLASYCIAALARPALFKRTAFEVAATAGLAMAAVAVVGYMFNTQSLYAMFLFTAMALHTALGFTALFVAILLSKPDASWARVLLQGGIGSAGARRVLPIVILGPLIICLVGLTVTRTGVSDSNFRLSVIAITMIALIGATVLRNAARENRAQQELFGVMNNLYETMDKLEFANAEKELLLREVYHRVKNNLQQVNAILRMEARQMNDPALTRSMKLVEERVAAMGLVHQLLVSSDKLSQVRMDEFLPRLLGNLSLGNDLVRRKIKLSSSVDPHQIRLEGAISVGLILNELIINAIEHAFPNDAAGTITISYSVLGDGVRIVVSDDGAVAARPGGGTAIAGSGMKIVTGFVENLDGEMTFTRDNGMTVTIDLPADYDVRASDG
ncbi:sensor histidine kinase [Acuticoccus sp. MNP-M23]|uniref:sensor histidine kinase n=1 Tax=Acuticoccus sp. MNP-M23 TaxID=3072793 RepID=UPI002815AB68|nr:sensor histidine kinase [Acuticoccus sp. MNP-M23]WMS42202.1 sensor histidine kinase [Acuticoccus sp. MNP-M23]